MSFNVLIIPEDLRKDQYVLKPIFKRMLSECGKPKAKVEVCQERLGGVREALKKERLETIIEDYRWMVNLFILCVDRDGDEHRRTALDNLESWAESYVGANRKFFGVEAWQEIEVWVIAGHDLLEGWDWQTIRAERDPKEVYFHPLAETLGLQDQPGEGRHRMTDLAMDHYNRIKQLCPEDLGVLESRIRDWIGTQNT